MLYAWLTGWNKRAFLRWTVQLQNLIHAGTGAHQICCFGVNPHAVWEMTSNCNLKCSHCHAFGGEVSYNELSKEEGIALIDQIAALGIRTFVFTGGEPLLREDLFELIAYAKSKRLNVFIATNGTLITKEVAKLLKAFDVGVVIGLDGICPETHDSIRGVEGAYDAVIAGIENCTTEKLYLHVNVVASKRNFDEIGRIIDYGDSIGAYSYFVYNFVPCGRGETFCDAVLDHDEFNTLLDLLLKKQRDVQGIIIPVAAPEYWAYALQRRGIHRRRIIQFLGQFIGGCLADKGMMYIKPDGDVWACPFLPAHVGTVRQDSVDTIWDNLQPFTFSHGENECARCDYARVCGGCKARMLSKDFNCACVVNKRAATTLNNE